MCSPAIRSEIIWIINISGKQEINARGFLHVDSYQGRIAYNITAF